MSHDTPLRWRSVFLGPVVLLLLVLTCYFGSYFWWIRHTKSGREFDHYFSRHSNQHVSSGYARFFRPARLLEKQLGFARYRRWLPGTWTTESGDVTMEVRDDLTAEFSGLATHGFRDHISGFPADVSSIYLRLVPTPTDPDILIYPLPDLNKVGVLIRLDKDWDLSKSPKIILTRSGSLDAKPVRNTP